MRNPHLLTRGRVAHLLWGGGEGHCVAPKQCATGKTNTGKCRQTLLFPVEFGRFARPPPREKEGTRRAIPQRATVVGHGGPTLRGTRWDSRSSVC